MIFRLLKEPNDGSRLIAEVAFKEGDLIVRIVPDVYLSQPTWSSVQVAADRHVDELGVLAYLNHSCAPNTYVDVSTLAVMAAREVASGEELTFFYPSTEWEMARPFTCWCAADVCLGQIGGAKTVPTSILAHHRLSPHIRALLALRDAPEASCGRQGKDP